MADLEMNLPLPTINWCISPPGGTASPWSRQCSPNRGEVVLLGVRFLPFPIPTSADARILSGGSQVLSNTMTEYIKKHAPNALQLNQVVNGILNNPPSV
jgi:hypothetical protein